MGTSAKDDRRTGKRSVIGSVLGLLLLAGACRDGSRACCHGFWGSQFSDPGAGPRHRWFCRS